MDTDISKSLCQVRMSKKQNHISQVWPYSQNNLAGYGTRQVVVTLSSSEREQAGDKKI